MPPPGKLLALVGHTPLTQRGSEMSVHCIGVNLVEAFMTFFFNASSLKRLCLLAASAALVSCGGGGGGAGGGAAFSGGASSPPLSDLRITEVSAKASAAGAEGGWFEVYNPTAAPIQLADYSLTSTAFDSAVGLTSGAFTLPAATIAPGGFVVLASKVVTFLPDGPQLKYIGSPSLFPSWADSGFLEIRRTTTSEAVDSVRFGGSSITPGFFTDWTGAAATALPIGAAAYGKSLVRLAAGGYADTNTAADWVVVNFSTPGGANDVAPGVLDADGDGVPSSAKVAGGTYGGMDLYAMGARAGQRDVFLEINVMDQAGGTAPEDLGFKVRKEALQKVVDAFAAKNIKLHIDAGSRFSAAFDPANFNLGGSNAAGTISFKPCTDLPVSGASVIRPECSNFFAHKNANLDVRRRVVFAYMLFASSQLTTGEAGSSGIAEINGNDAMITMGKYGFTTVAAYGFTGVQNTQQYINMQASTVMHEFGHNLGLRHGGFENANYKPNYLSVMNYMYQLVGLPGARSDSTVGDRYLRYVSGLNNQTATGACVLTNSRCTSTFIIDYSDGSSADLSENALVGSNLVGRGIPVTGSFINWSGTATFASPAYGFDVNRDLVTNIVKDYSDWANVKLPFVRSASGFNSGVLADSSRATSSLSDAPKRDAMNDAVSKEFVREDAPSAQFFRMLRD